MNLPVGAVIGAVAGVGSALIGASSAKKAAKAQVEGADKASATTLAMYNTTRDDLAPWVAGGRPANATIARMYGLDGGEGFSTKDIETFERSPDYKVALNAGIKARDKSAAARGNLLSGGQEKRLAEYGSELASQKFDQYMGNLFKISGMGQNAAAMQGNAAMTTGSNLAKYAMDAGESEASGIIGAGSALSNGLTGLGSNLAYYSMRNPSAYGSVQPSIY